VNLSFSDMYQVTKTFGHDLGLSACFRQWRATSHCRYLHGYALAFTFTVESEELDARNWVVDFGAFKEVKTFLVSRFDHKLVVAEDDPRLDEISLLGGLGAADVFVLPHVGCEAFARYVFDVAYGLIHEATEGRGRLVSVECREHGANAATYTTKGDRD
jgi:6-pyruvoyltetrahydropterin/6-carboxytetrahydropterin synthase